MLKDDTLRRVLYIDLSHRSFRVEERPDLFEAGLGGAGVAIRLLEEECPEGADPLGPENPVIFTVGPLVGLFPMASKTVSMFKSPHTGNLGESHCGGRSAVSIRMAGYGAIVIQGTSPTPVYLVIDDDKVHFRDASALWGVRSSYTVGAVLRERESGSGLRTIMRIGRAGEQGVSYASVVTETYRHFGRLGLGAVLGSKQVKALAISGCRKLSVGDRRAYRKVYDDIYKSATESSLMQKYHDLGTPKNVLPINAMNALPTRNLEQAHFDQAEAISGETMAEQYLGRRVACAHCPVACVHIAALRLPHPKEPHFYSTSMLGYDYEPIYANGSMLGGSDVSGMLQLLDEIEVQGVDAMSTGVVLAWATEMLENGSISTDETDGLELSWGDYPTYIQAVQRIVDQPNDFYQALAHGVEHASSIYGGSDIALSFGGNEMPGYHTGPAAYMTYLTGARHSHLDSAGYDVDEEAARDEDKSLTPEGVVQSLLKEERWRQVLSSLVLCYFARGVYTSDVVQQALSVAGFDRSGDDLTQMGTETLKRKHQFKRREGFDLQQQRLPERIFETPSALGKLDKDFMKQAIQLFVEATSEE